MLMRSYPFREQICRRGSYLLSKREQQSDDADDHTLGDLVVWIELDPGEMLNVVEGGLV